MQLPPSTSLLLAGTSWVVNLLAQLHGMTTKPNVKDIHESNMSFYSPNATMIAAYFFCHQLAQCSWLYVLYKSVRRVKSHSESLDHGKEMDRERDLLQIMLTYVPIYALGNFCLAGWVFFWLSSSFAISDALVAINLIAHLYFLYSVLTRRSPPSTQSFLTHLNVKMMTAISVLDLLHNTSVAFYNHQRPFDAAQVILYMAFISLFLSAGDWTFGTCLLYDLLALVLGQYQLGNDMFAIQIGAVAGGMLIFTVLRNAIIKPRLYPNTDYRPLAA